VQRKLVVHVADIDVGLESGMGRVAAHWRDEIERQGHEFMHIGRSVVGPMRHRAWFPYHAWRHYANSGRTADVFLVHEPASSTFAARGRPLAVFSHGLERRAWQQRTGADARVSQGPLTLKQRISTPLLRLRQCDGGMRRADLLLLINREDAGFAHRYYRRPERDIFVFRNGVDAAGIEAPPQPATFTVVFNGTWIPRKGTPVLVEAARILHARDVRVRWILAGTQVDAPAVLSEWPEELRADTRVIPSFASIEEREILANASVFVLPSVFEGQPLSLLQAMAAGLCCITTDCCGQRDVIVHDENGLLFPVGDACRLADLIARCVRDVALRVRLGRAARCSVGDRTWANVSREVADRVLALLPR
jgi:glycosyltransferase involved in cell wall biosynthesis